jgi:hypothetical protein
MPNPSQILKINRLQALALADRVGQAEVKKILRQATEDLSRRLDSAIHTKASSPTTIREMQATLGQLRDLVTAVSRNLGRATVKTGKDAAEAGASALYDYMSVAQKAYGLPSRPLAIREAFMFSRAVSGAETSILRSLATKQEESEKKSEDPDPDAGEQVPPQMMRKEGVLSRYSMETIGQFESILQNGILTGEAWADTRAKLVDRSPFLQGAPASWAERIIRTETMRAFNRSGWESIRAADDELGDMCKILCATFDDRTGWDSYQVHGQIRMPDEAFEWAEGFYQHPPNRPNDREVVLPHRISWQIPPELSWRPEGEVFAAWRRDRRRGAPPARPEMTTIPLDRFARGR